MILEFGAKNCLSFKDWLQVSFEAPRKDTPSEYYFSEKRVFPWLCLEGSNASGKTNSLKVLSFIYSFASESFAREPNSDIPYDTFFNNDDKSEFYLNFTLEDYKKTEFSYQYEFVLKNKKVYSEKLYQKKGTARKKIIFSRINNKITDTYFGTDKKIIYRDNVSFFSTLFQYGIKKSEPFKKHFTNYFANVNYSGVTQLTDPDINQRYYENPELLEMLKEDLKYYDLGIADIKIEIDKNPMTNNKDKYYPVFYHYTENSTESLLSYSQSARTLKLFRSLLFYKLVLLNGGLLIIDELDKELHDDIVYDLLSKFKVENNKNNAQLIFTSYNTLLLDEAKKYRSYLFEKEKGESYCYRADEIALSIRNDRSLAALYNNGDLGGKSKIG